MHRAQLVCQQMFVAFGIDPTVHFGNTLTVDDAFLRVLDHAAYEPASVANFDALCRLLGMHDEVPMAVLLVSLLNVAVLATLVEEHTAPKR